MVELVVDRADRSTPVLVVRKQLDEPERLAHQVRWLTRAQGPGVGRLHHVDVANGFYSTRFAGSSTIATIGDPGMANDAIEGLWSVLERLHRLGLVHGAVRADHVVIGASGPTLVSPGGPHDVARRHDIVGFGTLVADLGHLWSAADTVNTDVVDRWIATGRALAELGANHDRSRVVSGAEVRRLLTGLKAVDRVRSTRWPLRKRRCGSDRGRRAG